MSTCTSNPTQHEMRNLNPCNRYPPKTPKAKATPHMKRMEKSPRRQPTPKKHLKEKEMPEQAQETDEKEISKDRYVPLPSQGLFLGGGLN